MNKLADERRIRILHALLERDAQRSIVRREKVSIKTVARLLADAGDMAIEHMRALGGFRFRCVQADELHSYVGARQRNVPRMKSKNPDAGTVWTFLAIDCDSRFVFDYRLGAQNVYDATSFMKSVAAKLKRRTDGRFVRRPTIVTDGLHSYKEACQIAFGTDADVGVLKKKYSGTDPNGNLLPGSRYVESVRIPLIGSPRREDITTAYIERFNLTLRSLNRRYIRRDLGFSKRLNYHERQLALLLMYYNYCWTLGPRPATEAELAQGLPHRIKRNTPAMEAGLADHIWEIKDLLKLTDEFVARRASEALEEEKPAEVDPSVPTHWVYHHHNKYEAVIHKATCTNCNDGAGKKGRTGKFGIWHPFASEELAVQAAMRLEPDRFRKCNMCIGKYRNAYGYRGPRK